jgi:hypothetical protein
MLTAGTGSLYGEHTPHQAYICRTLVQLIKDGAPFVAVSGPINSNTTSPAKETRAGSGLNY